MRRLTTIGLLLTLLVLSTGCASPTIDLWADRSVEGLGYAREHIQAFAGKVQEGLRAKEAAEIEILDDELHSVVTGEIEGVEYSREWLRHHRITIDVIREGHAANHTQLREDVKNALANLDEIAEGQVHIKRLRRAWTVTDEMRAEVDRLASLVQRLITENRGRND